MADVMIRTERLTLENVCDGDLIDQIEDAMADIGAAFENERLQKGREELKAKLSIEIDLVYNIRSRSVATEGSARPTLPKRRKVGGFALLRDGVFLVEPDTQEQLPLNERSRDRA